MRDVVTKSPHELLQAALRSKGSMTLADFNSGIFPDVQRGARDGDKMAAYLAGLALWEGDMAKKDPPSALIWFSQSAGQGFAPAAVALGRAYMSGIGVERNYAAALDWFQRANTPVFPLAQEALGDLYLGGFGVPKDNFRAFEMYQLAASNPMEPPSAQFKLGLMYEHGWGTVTDMTNALALLRRAANQRYADAEVEIGNMYRQGIGVGQDLAEANAYYYRAAQDGSLEGTRQVTTYCMQNLLEGKPTGIFPLGCYFWLTKLVERGGGTYKVYEDLGVLDLFGLDGVPQSSYSARDWFEKAVSDGNSIRGRQILACLYYKGIGGLLDRNKARVISKGIYVDFDGSGSNSCNDILHQPR